MGQRGKNVSPMSNEGRNAYVVEHITDAMLQLLTEKEINDITISELCARAQVGRASFYRNYAAKEEVLKKYLGGLLGQWVKEHELLPEPALSDTLGSLFAHFEEHRDFYALLNRRGMTGLLKDVLIEICGPKPQQTAREAYAYACVAYILYDWIETWFQRGMKETAEEIAGMFKGI